MMKEVKNWPPYLDSPKPEETNKSDDIRIAEFVDIIYKQSAEINRYKDAISKIKDIINTIC